MFSYFDGSLEDYLHYIKDVNDNRLVKIKLCPATKMEDIGIDTSFHHVIDNFAVTHIVTKHSNEKETLRGQMLIDESDFHLISDIVSNYNSISVEKPRDGRTLIIYSKQYQECERFYVEEIRKGRH